MEQPFPGFRSEIRTLKMIHLAMIAGQVLFAAVAFFLVFTGMLDKSANNLYILFRYLVPVCILGGLIGSHFVFRSRLEVIRSDSELSEKLLEYRTTLIIRYAMLEGGTFIALVAYLVVGNHIYLLAAVLVILYFLTLVPNTERVTADLGLNEDEKHKLNGTE